MPWTHSGDLRTLVAVSVRSGLSAREAAARWPVSASSAARWAREWAQTGALAPGRGGGRGRRMLAGERDWLRAEVAARPGITLAALQAGLRARGVEAGRDTVWRFLREQGLGVGSDKR